MFQWLQLRHDAANATIAPNAANAANDAVVHRAVLLHNFEPLNRFGSKAIFFIDRLLTNTQTTHSQHNSPLSVPCDCRLSMVDGAKMMGYLGRVGAV